VKQAFGASLGAERGGRGLRFGGVGLGQSGSPSGKSFTLCS
jgi:hypothetical protein